MRVGDIIFAASKYTRPRQPVLFGGPALVTKIHESYGRTTIDLCYLNNPHTDEPQGLGQAYISDFMLMDSCPDEWRKQLSWWVTRAITSFDKNLTMNYEAGEGALLELKRLGL